MSVKLHFLYRTIFASDEELFEAKKLVEKYKEKQEPAGTTREQVIYAKKLYESSFHPDNGDLQNVFGRMSFQVPGGKSCHFTTCHCIDVNLI